MIAKKQNIPPLAPIAVEILFFLSLKKKRLLRYMSIFIGVQ
jgi:hypothetical protein